MPLVSILIPAYRPDFFDACIASALAQTMRDFEIIVGDDCPGEDIARLLAKWDEPRIRYVRNPTPGLYTSNHHNLMRLAQGKYLKFLFDDDLLYPRSVEMLVDAMRAGPAKVAFHHRHLIDATGRILSAPTFVPAASVSVVPAQMIYSLMIARMANPVGEPTNVMVDAEALRSMGLAFENEGRPARYLTDVTMLYNAARAGHGIVGVGAFGSAFRQHASQNSHESSPIFAAGIFEWELLARSAYAAGLIRADEYRQALERVHAQYRRYEKRHPCFSRFLGLDAGDSAAAALDERFWRVLDLAYLEMDLRRIGPLTRGPAEPAPPQAAPGPAHAGRPAPEPA